MRFRGPKGAFQKWADEVDDQSYSLDHFNQYFLRSINFTAPDISKRSPNATPGYDEASLSSTRGPVPITYANWAVPFSRYDVPNQLLMNCINIYAVG